MGEYIDEIREITKKEILDLIASIRFGDNNYLFVNTMDAKSLVFDGKRLENPIPHPFLNLFTSQLEKVKNPGGWLLFI